MKLKKVFLFIISVIFIFLSAVYGLFLFGLPRIINSEKAIHSYEQILAKKLDAPVKIKGFKFTSNPNLSVKVAISSISSKVKGQNVAELQDLYYESKILSLNPKVLNADTIYVNLPFFNKYFRTDKKTSQTKFQFDYLPIININRIYVQIDEKSNIEIINLESKIDNGQTICSFLGKLSIPYVKNAILIGSEGNISYKKKLQFNKLSIQLEYSKLYLTGTTDKLSVNGKNLPVDELETSFLYFYKLKHPNKKNFIENFQDMKGLMDVNLVWTDGGFFGNCTLLELRALFSKYKFPIYFSKAVFNFNKRKITTSSDGFIGKEKVHINFLLTGLLTKSVIVSGDVHTKLSNNFAKNYFPLVEIKGLADAFVQYKTHNGISDIKYTLTVDKGNNILSDYGDLNCTDKKRQIYAITQKIGDKIFIKDYTYNFIDKNKTHKILTGNGLFEKIKGHYTPSFITLKTDGQVPVSVLKSFTKDYITGGTFSSDIKYVFPTKTVTGFVNLYNIQHSDFLFLEKTSLNILGNDLKLTANGTFFDSPITMSFVADNNFQHNILIHDIDIHLNKFLVKRGEYSSLKNNKLLKKKKNSNSQKNCNNVIVEKGRIRVDEIKHTKFYLHDVEILGTLKNNTVDFVIPETDYAKGILSAKGLYNIKNHSSDINFLASNIDSDEVVTKIFNLAGQVQGLASATLHLKTKNKLNDIKAYATFAISDGFLPKIGSKEFIVKKSKKMAKFKFLDFEKIKFSLSKITNLDFSNKKTFSSDINGSFYLNNNDVDDVKIFSQSDYLSVFIEGHYNIDSQFAHLYVWGRHNKTEEKKIRILKLPFTFLYRLIFRVERSKEYYQDKLDMIPPIKLRAGDIESVFRVFVNGNINSDNLKVILKDLR